MKAMSSREMIVDAAMAIVREQGLVRLTLDETARVAGRSKGGVLYHFSSKDALIRALIERQVMRTDDRARQLYEAEAPGPYRWARAIVRLTFDPVCTADDLVNSTLLAVVATDRTMMEPIEALYRTWDERLISDAPDPDRARLIAAAMDGLFYQTLLGVQCLPAEAVARIEAHALALLGQPAMNERDPACA